MAHLFIIISSLYIFFVSFYFFFIFCFESFHHHCSMYDKKHIFCFYISYPKPFVSLSHSCSPFKTFIELKPLLINSSSSSSSFLHHCIVPIFFSFFAIFSPNRDLLSILSTVSIPSFFLP